MTAAHVTCRVVSIYSPPAEPELLTYKTCPLEWNALHSPRSANPAVPIRCPFTGDRKLGINILYQRSFSEVTTKGIRYC